jgi:hypothetical protein
MQGHLHTVGYAMQIFCSGAVSHGSQTSTVAMQEVVLQHEKGTPDGQVVLPDGTQIGTPELLKLDPLKPFWPQEEDKDVLTPTSRKVCVC